MKTILERYKTLPFSNAVPDAVELAHEAENVVCRAVRDYMIARHGMAVELAKDWSPEEIKESSLDLPRNPNHVFNQLGDLLELHLSPEMANAREIVRLFRELQGTLSPLLRCLPQ